ncbi:hypothetical protein [Halorubrum sp. AS12]|uniref:hypothetical protein n=1 Tax=Halorubrum sp. AS12 TaxID=3409687 RepID=UPI003DA6D763
MAERDRELVADVVAEHAVVDRKQGRQLLSLDELFVGLHRVQPRPRSDRRSEAGRKRKQERELERLLFEQPNEPDDDGERRERSGGPDADPHRPPPSGRRDLPPREVVRGVEGHTRESDDQPELEQHAHAPAVERQVPRAETGADPAERDEPRSGETREAIESRTPPRRLWVSRGVGASRRGYSS